VARLRQALETGFGSIRLYLDMHNSESQAESQQTDVHKVAPMLRSAYEALESLSPDTIEPLLAALLPLLEAAHQHHAKDALEAVANFDFRGARAALEKLAVQLKLELPHAH